MSQNFQKINKLSLPLFNVVLENGVKSETDLIEKHGVFLDENSAYAKEQILEYLESLSLTGKDLNKTFYLNWEKVKHFKIFRNIEATDFIKKIPYIKEDKEFDIPDFDFSSLEVFTIEGVSKKTLVNKCLDIMISGIAIKEETLKDLFLLLELVGYKFTGKEGIKNKEAKIYLAEHFSIFPEQPEEFLRYLVYTCTQSTTLIKNQSTLIAITKSNEDFSSIMTIFGLEKLATIFNRFKPIFLAFKAANNSNKSVINRLSKMSKKLHKPTVENPVNLVTQELLTDKDIHWLKNATLFALFKALKSCHSRIQGQTSFVYRIRNGKSWGVEKDKVNIPICQQNYDFILKFLKENFNFKDRTVLMPLNIHYALPTSEKMFVGNIPTGTKFYGSSIATGIYWENDWGANDLDLSGINIDGKIGWNTQHSQSNNKLHYSGDIRNAPNGAVEYLLSESKSYLPSTLVVSNVYSGEPNSGYKIIIAEGDNIDKKLMLNPNKVMAEIKTESLSNNMILGLLSQEDKLKSFTLLNFSGDSSHVINESKKTTLFTKALYEEWSNPLMLSDILSALGFNVIYEAEEDKEPDFNLNIRTLNKSTFIDLFKE